jgi:hypothetical protein
MWPKEGAEQRPEIYLANRINIYHSSGIELWVQLLVLLVASGMLWTKNNFFSHLIFEL